MLCQQLDREWFKETFQALSIICKEEECGLMPDIRYGTSDTAVSRRSHRKYIPPSYLEELSG
jgi:hypothetical protein